MALYEFTGTGEPLPVTPPEASPEAMPHLAPLTKLATSIWEKVAAGNTAQFPGHDARLIGGKAVLTQHLGPTQYVRHQVEWTPTKQLSIVHETQRPTFEDEALGGFVRTIARYTLDGTTAKTRVSVMGRLHEDGTLRPLEGEEPLLATYGPVDDQTCQKLLLELQAVTGEYPLVQPREHTLPAKTGWLKRFLKAK